MFNILSRWRYLHFVKRITFRYIKGCQVSECNGTLIKKEILKRTESILKFEMIPFLKARQLG